MTRLTKILAAALVAMSACSGSASAQQCQWLLHPGNTPTKHIGEKCSDDSECYTGACYPGPGLGNFRLCLAKSRNCAWPGEAGGMYKDTKTWQGDEVTCMNPQPNNVCSRGRFAYP